MPALILTSQNYKLQTVKVAGVLTTRTITPAWFSDSESVTLVNYIGIP